MTLPNPVQISFRRVPRSDLVEDEVHLQVEHLSQFSDRLHGCEVVIEPDERHHRSGRRYRVGVRAHVPGRELVVGRHPARPGHEDPLLAVRDAFRALGRQLQDYEAQRRHQVKPHFDPACRARVAHLEMDHGFLESYEGREVYFHRNALVNVDFDELSVGAEVRFEEAAGEQGPQASTVALTGRRVD